LGWCRRRKMVMALAGRGKRVFRTHICDVRMYGLGGRGLGRGRAANRRASTHREVAAAIARASGNASSSTVVYIWHVMRRKIPSTHALACFEAAARHESYTRAAQELAMTQSAVSRQISGLEAYLGVELFRRTRHGVVLTASGADFARQTGRLLESLERAALDAAARQGGGGTLMLGVVPTFATRWLLPRLPDLARRHPDITLHLETRTRPFLFSDTDFDAALY